MTNPIVPILSIAIVNFNYGRFLGDTLRSIIAQCGSPVIDSNGKVKLPVETGDFIEVLLADGGSKDESLQVIEQYKSYLAWWVSEPDTGQSNAFNKCFSHAEGRYLTWVNADDIVVPGAMVKVVREITRHPDCEWFTANNVCFTSDGKVVAGLWGPHFYPKWLQFKSSPFISFGPSTFFSKISYEKVGKIDERFHYIMDTDLWCRFIVAGIKQRRIRCFFWGFRLHENSKTGEYGDRRLTPETFKRIALETRLSHERSGYRMSKWLRFMMWGWRVLDGSMLFHLLFMHCPCLIRVRVYDFIK